LFWGNRVGKSQCGAAETARVLLGEHEFIPRGDVWSFCPSFDEQKDTTQLKLLSYIPENRITSKIWLRKGILKEIEIDGKAKVTFKSYEQGREKAQGAGKTLIWFDEEPPKDIYEECFVRVEAGIKLYIIMTMTPIKGLTWVYDDIYLKTDNPDYFVSSAGWDDNPYLTEDQKLQMGRGLSQQALKVRREGKFVRMVGLVCNWFDREIHVIDLDINTIDGDDYACIDFGFSAPSAYVLVRIDREFNWYVHDGFYRKGQTTPDLARIIKQKETGLQVRSRVADSAQAETIAQLRDEGVHFSGVKKRARGKENWDEYRAGLLSNLGRIQEATNKPKIFISKHLVDRDDEGGTFNFLVKEIENLRWDEVKVDGKDQQAARWGKQPDHAIDALTYLMHEITKPEENQENFTNYVSPFNIQQNAYN